MSKRKTKRIIEERRTESAIRITDKDSSEHLALRKAELEFKRHDVKTAVRIQALNVASTVVSFGEEDRGQAVIDLAQRFTDWMEQA